LIGKVKLIANGFFKFVIYMNKDNVFGNKKRSITIIVAGKSYRWKKSYEIFLKTDEAFLKKGQKIILGKLCACLR